MKRFLAAAALLFAALQPGPSQAAEMYPTRPVKIVVPQSPGGTTDVFARQLANRLSARWGQPVIVDYRAGAGGNMGAEYVTKSKPDGYTLMLGYVGTQAVNGAVYSHLGYDPLKDFAPVVAVATVPFITVVNDKLPARDMNELVALARSRSLTYATSGNGSLNQLMGEMLNGSARIQTVHVPYKGIAQALTDTIGGQVDILHAAVPAVVAQVKAGLVKPIAVTSARRIDSLPEVPTMAESGWPGLQFDAWFGLFAPAGTPPEVLRRIHDDVAAILEDKDTVSKFADVGAEPLRMSREEFDATVRRDAARWGQVARDANVHID